MDRVRRPLILLHKECYYPLQYSSCFSDAYELRFYNYREWNRALTRGIRVRESTRAWVLMKPMKHCTVILIEFRLTQRTRKILLVTRYRLYLRLRRVWSILNSRKENDSAYRSQVYFDYISFLLFYIYWRNKFCSFVYYIREKVACMFFFAFHCYFI